MQEILADDVPNDSGIDTDICIVGGGAAGIAIAKSFVNSNINVILLESGTHSYNDETQELYEFENVGHPVRSQMGYISRNRYLGGSTNTWAGRCAPMDKSDFERRDWVPHSGWPINRQDLDSYYDKAANFLRLPSSHFFFNGAWRKFLLKTSNRFLNDDKLDPIVFLLAKKPINVRKAYAQELKKTGNIKVYLNANVTELVTDVEETEITKVNVATLRGTKFIIRAKNYILSCGGWENARLLLASNKVNSAGVGNIHDNVGRYYAEHPKILGSKLILSSKTLRSPIMFWPRKISRDGSVRIGIKLSARLQKKHGITNNCIELMYPQSMRDAIEQSEKIFRELNFSRSAINRLVKIAPHVFSILDAFERLVFNLPLKFEHVTMISHMEQIPNRDSRLYLGKELDALDMPKLQVKLDITSQDKENMRRFHQVLNDVILEQGLGKLESQLPEADKAWPDLTDSSHHIGTTRMSEDPKFGVVDKNCKVHNIKNLYIAGSSVFPTGGHVNPTLTIVALAFRLAEHLKEDGKYG